MTTLVLNQFSFANLFRRRPISQSAFRGSLKRVDPLQTLQDAGIHCLDPMKVSRHMKKRQESAKFTPLWFLMNDWTINPVTTTGFACVSVLLLLGAAVALLFPVPFQLVLFLAVSGIGLLVLRFMTMFLTKCAGGNYAFFASPTFSVRSPARWITVPLARNKRLPDKVSLKISAARAALGGKADVTISELWQDRDELDPVAWVNGIPIAVWEDDRVIMI